MPSFELPQLTLGLCPSLMEVVSSAREDAKESGYRACRRHLVMAAFCSADIKKILPDLEELRLANLKRQAALATNLMLDKSHFPRRPGEDQGVSDGFNSALVEADTLAKKLEASCIGVSHLLAVLKESTLIDEDGVNPNFWDWTFVHVQHQT